MTSPPTVDLTADDSGEFEGKVAIITGASRGIGLGIARRLSASGAFVCLTGRGAEGLETALAELPDGKAIAVAGGADDPEHRAEVFAQVAEVFGRLDLLVNNAGINPVYGPVIDLDLRAARKIFEVNVIGTLSWTQEAVASDLGVTSIVNISSVLGDIPSPGIGWYGVSKAAVSHLTRTLAVELAPRIRVNAVAPAVIKTQFAQALYEGREEQVAEEYPMKRLGTPEDVAEAVAYLASDRARWITGQVLTIDGGLLTAGGSA